MPHMNEPKQMNTTVWNKTSTLRQQLRYIAQTNAVKSQDKRDLRNVFVRGRLSDLMMLSLKICL